MSEIIHVESSNALETIRSHYQIITQFVREQMIEGIDYGVIPGTNGKQVLLKPGGEKLCRLLNLRPTFHLIDSIVDFDKPLFHYHYQCTLYHQGELVGQAEGNCNSFEKKFKKQEYRVFDLTNTICKLAQKRALIAAVLCTVGASEFFTQDLDDMEVEESPKQTRSKGSSSRGKVRNITPKTQPNSNTNKAQSPDQWYQKGKDDARNGNDMKYPKVKPYVEGFESVKSA